MSDHDELGEVLVAAEEDLALWSVWDLDVMLERHRRRLEAAETEFGGGVLELAERGPLPERVKVLAHSVGVLERARARAAAAAGLDVID